MRKNCCHYNFRLMNFRQAIKITSSESIFASKFSFRFYKTVTVYLFRSFYNFCVCSCLHVYMKVKFLICASIIDTLHTLHCSDKINTTAPASSLTPLPPICRGYNYSLILNEFLKFWLFDFKEVVRRICFHSFNI